MLFTGWDSVTVPGAVSGWRTTWERFGSLPFEDLFEPAIEYATNGYVVSHTVHRQWQAQVPVLRNEPGFAESFAPRGRAPLPGERFVLPRAGETLTRIARSGGEDFYHGELARKIADHARATGGRIDEADLAAHRADWVEPIRMAYRDLELYEIGPNGQGIGALMALGMLEHWDIAGSGLDSARTMHLQIEAMKLALPTCKPMWAISTPCAGPARCRPRRCSIPPTWPNGHAPFAPTRRRIPAGQAAHGRHGLPDRGRPQRDDGVVHPVELQGFGSGVVVPGTGIALHNRGWGFSLEAGHPNQVAPGKRPFHTIIPGFLMRDGAPLASFGVMGGSMQAQGHVQMTSRLADFGQNPQAASDAPRWRVMDDNVGVAVEAHCPPATVEGLRAMGHKVEQAPADSLDFGGAQMAMKMPHGYAAASDSRKDGYPVGF